MKAMEAVALQRPDWRPASALDVGVGVGAASWAAVSRWPSLERLVGIDAEPAMLALGSTLRAGASHPALRGASWSRGRAEESSASIERFDLVLLSYVLGELPEPARTEVVAWAWAACAGTLIVVEPGTPAGYRNVLAARVSVTGSGGWTTPPCPHDPPCPMSGGGRGPLPPRGAPRRGHRGAQPA